MSFARRGLSAVIVFLLFTASTAAFAAQAAPAPAAQPAATVPAQHAPQSAAAYSLSPEKLAQARVLGHIRTTLDIVGSLWGLAFLWIFLAAGWAARLSAWALRVAKRRWLQGLVFFALFFLISTLASLPLDLIGHIASLHYKISVQGWASWIGDQAKGLALSVVFGSLVLLLFNWLVRRSPRFYWIWIWLVTLPLMLAAIFASPLIIDPLFNKFEPLMAHHAPLVQKLESVVARTGNHIAPERMFLMKASEKSNGLNAYVTGIGASKRFVMWDTATDRLPDDEVMFIFGHESGHYVLNHIPKMIAGSTAATFFVFWLCSVFTRRIVARKGAAWGFDPSAEEMEPAATRPGFLVLLFALSVVGLLTQPVSNAFSRHFEHQADVYGQEAIHGLVPDSGRTAVSAFNHLGEAWLEDPDPNPIVEFWEYNHPSVQRRASFAVHYDPWVNGGRGQYFSK
ncbi:MAG: M48 family metallopeptidase [Terracidiphilus sp.]|nr:M48 family metallopeptidase [Terracidiphilus sp.]